MLIVQSGLYGGGSDMGADKLRWDSESDLQSWLKMADNAIYQVVGIRIDKMPDPGWEGYYRREMMPGEAVHEAVDEWVEREQIDPLVGETIKSRVIPF